MSKLVKALTGASGLVAVTILTSNQTAFSQDATPDRETAVSRMLDTITISATKQNDVEDVQSVGLAVSAFNENSIDALKVRDVESLSYSAPNVTLSDIGTTKGSANFSMRGLGVNSSIPSIDPTVGMIIDGVYMGSASGVVIDMFDLESIEILRGPQGILQGRNTTAGAVVVNTANPTDELEYKVRVATETPLGDNRGGMNTYVQGAVSGPVIPGKINGKFAAYFNSDEGYFKNLFNGENQGEAETTFLRAAAEFFPESEFRILTKLEYGDMNGDGPAAQNRAYFDRDSFDFSINEPGSYDIETLFGSVRADWDIAFGDGTITNILGYRSMESPTSGEVDSTPETIFHSISETDHEQFSNELRYNGSFGDLTLTTGLFVLDQTIKYTEGRVIGTGVPQPPFFPNGIIPFWGGGEQDHFTYGIFAQGDYAFTDRLTGSLGLRYSYEEKDAKITNVTSPPERLACSVVNGTCPVNIDDENDWSSVTPKLAVEYLVSDDDLLYASYNRGFRSGGYNFRRAYPSSLNPTLLALTGGNEYFDEETVDAFEIGYKFQSDDGRVRVNSAIFHNKAKDLQREINVVSPTGGVIQLIVNSADADISGLEVETQVAITDTFLLTGNFGIIDAEYTELQFPISAVSLEGLLSGQAQINPSDLNLELPRTPKSTYGLGFIWDKDLGKAGSLVTRANYQFRDKSYYTDNNLGYFNAIDMLDANIDWNTPMEGVTLSLYGKNLLDEVQAGGDTQLPAFIGASPLGGTFSPLKKGALIGLELTLRG